MKRILFYTENFSDASSRGGTEIATFRIAKALKDSGQCEVYNAFRKKWDGESRSVYHDVVKLPGGHREFESALAAFIRAHNIDVVVNMTRFFRHNSLNKAIEKSGRDVKLIFMQHFAPGSEFKKATFKSGRHLLSLNPRNPLYWLRASVYPLLKMPRNRALSKKYREVYDSSDKVILLSEGYIEDYCKIAGIEDRSKFEVIPNIYGDSMNSAPDCQVASDPQEIRKEKRVLILSRMDEIQKRLSLALQIWRNIEKDEDLSDWQLDIVGAGHNMDIVKRLVKKYGLTNVNIHGWQASAPFLRRSEILMMTSEYEGLPLSLLEAQEYGVVPVAFNAFSSLKDVVTPFETGVVVEKFGDIEDYTAKLSELMYDAAYREELRKNGRRNVRKFSSEKIADKWLKILI